MEKKVAIQKWLTESQIPGKLQSMLTCRPDSDGDWCIRNERHGNQMRLGILGPSEELDPPEIVTKLFDYLIQEHQYYMRKAMTQLWVRSAGPGQWALVLHLPIRGAGTGHALKLFEQHLIRLRPEVVALHRLETRPWYPFRFDHPPRAMKYDLHPIFGPEILPLGDSGLVFHVLEWLPQLRHPYLELPARILSAISPKPSDMLLEMHCGSGIIGCSMASHFQEVHCVDARGISKLSVLANVKHAKLSNVHYHQETVDLDFLTKFFAKREGQWTIILNPQQGEALPSGVIRQMTELPIGRVVYIGSNLETIAAETKRWRRAGFLLRKIVPFDLNPTTNRIELAMFFAPDREGVLRQGAMRAEEKRLTTPVEKAKALPKTSTRATAKSSPNTPRFVQKGKTSSIGRGKKRG